MAKTAISLKSVSEKTILKNLYDFVKSHKDSAKWIDYLESSSGVTIMELIASYGYFKFYHEVMMARESKLETAIMKSSIIELAFNRGLLLAPTHTGKVSLTIRSFVDTVITRGAVLGSLSDYDVIAAMSVSAKSGVSTTIPCYIGHLNEFKKTMYGFGPFSKIVFNLQDKYIAEEFESFTVNNKKVGLLSDLNYLTQYGNDFCVRRVRDNEVRIYSGNGFLGYKHEGTSEIVYNCISYGDDLTTKMNVTPNLKFEAILDNYTVTGLPENYMSKNQIKGMAAYYPLDGRIVQDKDYEIAVTKYFPNHVRDVFAYNSDPNEEIYIIMKKSQLGDTIREVLSDMDKEEIQTMIDTRRGMGIQVFYHWYKESEGIEFNIDVQIKSENIYAGMGNDVNGFFNSMLFKFARKDTTYYSKDFASQISSYFEFPVYDRSNKTVTLSKYQFFKKITINITPIDNDYIYMDSELETMKLLSE